VSLIVTSSSANPAILSSNNTDAALLSSSTDEALFLGSQIPSGEVGEVEAQNTSLGSEFSSKLLELNPTHRLSSILSHPRDLRDQQLSNSSCLSSTPFSPFTSPLTSFDHSRLEPNLEDLGLLNAQRRAYTPWSCSRQSVLIAAAIQEEGRPSQFAPPISAVQDLRLLGRGAGGAVYKGLWGHAPCAVKVVVSSTATALLNSQREAVLAKLPAHPNLVQTFVFDCTRVRSAWSALHHLRL
jgi:hypothetical protein